MENFKQVIFVLACILMLYAFMYLGIMIKNIALYFMRKSELIKKENSNVFTTRHIDYTNRIIEVINSIIVNEVVDFLKSLAVLKQKYNFINLDKDIGNISTVVYQAFKSSAYTSEYNILNEEYIMKYITNRVTLVLIEQATMINNDIREENSL